MRPWPSVQHDQVGALRLRYAVYPGKEITHRIFKNDQFDIGREDFTKAWTLDGLTVSKHHLRFRAVAYDDEEGEQRVSPMIYVRVLSMNAVKLECARDKLPVSTEVITRKHGDVLLGHGDVLHVTPQISLIFSAAGHFAARDGGLNEVQGAEAQQFRRHFLLTNRRLGVGGQASVLLAINQRTGRQLACKVVSLSRTRDRGRTAEKLKREYNVVKNLSHPNIVVLEKVICTTYSIYIFQELITGGDLLSYLDLKGPFAEPQAIVLVNQVLKAAEYLHSQGVVHRDIKPENVMMTSWRDGARLVLTDFGQARAIDEAGRNHDRTPAKRMQSLVGTTGFAAPEILQQGGHDRTTVGYSKAVDMWSIGCLTATLLTNTRPFEDDTDGRYSVNFMDTDHHWNAVGRKAKSFVKSCLMLDETLRVTAKQALLHPWFTNKHYSADLQAAYERAIQDWSPRQPDQNLIEVLDTTEAVAAALETQPCVSAEEQEETDVQSRHFRDKTQLTVQSSIYPQPGTWESSSSVDPLSRPLGETGFGGRNIDHSTSTVFTQHESIFETLSEASGRTQISSMFPKDSKRRLSILDLGPRETQLARWRPV